MNTSMVMADRLKGKFLSEEGRVYLRLMNEHDINDTYVSWFNDAEFTHFLDAKNLTHEQALAHLRQGYESGAWFMLAIVDAVTDKHIGNVKLGPISWPHKLSDMSTVIGEKKYWGKGYATEAIRIGIRIAFDVLDIRKLSAGIAENNLGSTKCYTSAGWVIEARLKGHHLINGEPEDRVCVSCFNPKYFPDV